MIKILFICHGNICRSPMAEFIFKDMLAKKGLTGKYSVASAATSSEEIHNGVGNPVYPPARRILAGHGISCEGKTARRMTARDYRDYDLLIGMDAANMRNMRRICGGDPDGRMRLLMSCTGRTRDVADPWYTGDFETAWADIYEGCECLLKELEGEGEA